MWLTINGVYLLVEADTELGVSHDAMLVAVSIGTDSKP
jgi:hypothetical protein